ncbi:MAG TPA: hypothetical protein VMT17_19200 [Anaeromyxobacteraceae bacterium]|nr:hypothetical protein [Anaeromyxobacteraceae bacterium]
MAKVGGEVDAFCSRCQLLLAHTVIAMVGAVPVKVECNTCRTEHRYRSAPKPSRPTSGGGAGRSASVPFEQMLASQTAAPRRYSPTESFAAGDVVDHPSFGRGFVSAQKDPSKVEVTFRTGVKVLVQGKR